MVRKLMALLRRKINPAFGNEWDAYDAGFEAGFDTAWDAVDLLPDRKSREDSAAALYGTWHNGREVPHVRTRAG
ncbi:hypothetical protein RsoP1IDN_6 [Ralstonia phage RsoP1IDN]|uniref:Uncharacterized protein n=1 Tax=Ralstonia phage RsoP1IDN TaxID=2060091 RepID=A0A2P0VPF4_9CAUD|nr:hypothetical protein HOS84_gp06 [Ralstonia phage RsoP1IDN]AUG85409.1 hypothetical protein RsoP1IDN_6 [Ralstonia phage RsoP1IDN]